MATLKTGVDGFTAAREYDNATLGRLAFWVDTLDDGELADITPDEVDNALVLLAERGRLRSGRDLLAERTGQPVAGSTLNRYVGQLASVFKYVRRLPLLDQRWRGMEAFIVLAYHTGLRKSNLLGLRWRDVNLDARTLSVQTTKNGDPMVAACH